MGIYYFVGNRAKYICRISKDWDYFNITDINVIDDQIMYEKELWNSTQLVVPWNIITDDSHSNLTLYQEDTEKVASLLSDYEAELKNEIKSKQIENKLIDNWNKLLQEEYILLNSKKSICTYRDFKLDKTGDRIYITIDSCDHPIEANDPLQLTSKESMEQKTVGQFIRLVDENTILLSLNQDVDLDEISSIGTLGIDIKQEKSNLRRFSLALNQVRKHDAVNPNILDIINNPTNVKMNSIQPLDMCFQSVFSDQTTPNAIAVKKALATRDMFLLQGPPGTGKTTVIAEIICQILHDDKNAKILLTSQSHVAVDHAIQKVAELLPDTCIVRIGRSEKIAESSEKLLHANKLDEWVRKTKEHSTNGIHKYIDTTIPKEMIHEYIDNYSLNTGGNSDNLNYLSEQGVNDKQVQILNLVSRWQKHLGKMDEFDEIFADDASIVAATCVGIASRNKVSNLTYDWVIIDEAARATPLETLIPIVKGRKTIMVGDHKQLPPIFKTKVSLKDAGISQSDIEKSLFEELIPNISSQAKLVLTEQFRMHPVISNMISQSFYPEENIMTKVNPADRKHYLKWMDKAIIWVDTSRIQDNKESPLVYSKKNMCEVKVISSILDEILNSYSRINRNISVGIISGYDAQKDLSKDSINPDDKDKWLPLSIVIDNVDAFQGSEVDIAIYDIVRSNEQGNIGFLDDVRRLNVALSRGKCCLIIVGNYNFIRNANISGYNPFTPIIKYIEANQSTCKKEVITSEQ